jgi:hypothetical protein
MSLLDFLAPKLRTCCYWELLSTDIILIVELFKFWSQFCLASKIFVSKLPRKPNILWWHNKILRAWLHWRFHAILSFLWALRQKSINDYFGVLQFLLVLVKLFEQEMYLLSPMYFFLLYSSLFALHAILFLVTTIHIHGICLLSVELIDVQSFFFSN